MKIEPYETTIVDWMENGPRLLRFNSIYFLTIIDRQINYEGAFICHFGDSYFEHIDWLIPYPIYCFLKNYTQQDERKKYYKSHQDANEALSVAAIAWARDRNKKLT